MATPDLARQITALALLEEPVRRALYDYVAMRPAAVGRDEAARAVRVSRALAAFHLDKLAAEGLLEVSYRRLSRRRGPGGGRPAKLYRRAARQLDVSLPPRRYELAARLLAAGVAGTRGGAAAESVTRAARRLGAALGTVARGDAGPRPDRARLLECAAAVLRDHGFEPERSGEGMQLRNCPFDALAREFRPLVCGMNRSLMEGLVSGLGARGVVADFRPEPGRCCVVLTPGGRVRSRETRGPTARS
jgi:predicted ArsR family transcriptional regulator